MKKVNGKSTGEMRPEYDFASMEGGVRGKYAKQYRAGTNLVLLDPKLAEVFPTDAAVNEALQAVVNMTRIVRPRKSTPDVRAGGVRKRSRG